MLNLQQSADGYQAVKRKLWVVIVVCIAWLFVGWMSLDNQLLGGVLWSTAQAAQSTQVAQNTPAYQSVQPSVALTGITYEWQTLNNCGPAVLAMVF